MTGAVLLGGPDRTAHKPLRPFTVDHWRRYTRLMRLDNRDFWVTEDWQDLFVEDVFLGFTDCWLIVPEGNGKTTLLGGLALYHGDHMEDASVPMAASSRHQCGILFGQASGFVRRSPGMRARFRVYDGYRKIKCLRTGGTIEVFSADERTGDGILFTLAIIDELHRHKDLGLYRTWAGKEGKRDGQVVTISTAGEPRTEFEDVRAAMVSDADEVTRSGRFTRAWSEDEVIHEYALRKEDDPEDLDLVKAANPFSGVTVETLAKARRKPSWSLAHWLRMKCNVATRTESAAVGDAEWSGQGVDGVDIPAGSTVDVGADLGWKWDTTALVPLWDRRAVDVRGVDTADELWETCGRLDAAQPKRAAYLFGRAKIIVPPRDGNSLDPQKVEDAFWAIDDRTPIARVVLDPSAGGEQLAAWLMRPRQWLRDEDDELVLVDGKPVPVFEEWVDERGEARCRRLGGLGVKVVIREQTGPLMADAAERFMEGLRLRAFQHCRDSRFTRQVLNAVLRLLPNGTSRFDRPAAARNSKQEERREIDAIVAASMVYAEVSGRPSTRSIYESKDLLVLD